MKFYNIKIILILILQISLSMQETITLVKGKKAEGTWIKLEGYDLVFNLNGEHLSFEYRGTHGNLNRVVLVQLTDFMFLIKLYQDNVTPKQLTFAYSLNESELTTLITRLVSLDSEGKLEFNIIIKRIPILKPMAGVIKDVNSDQDDLTFYGNKYPLDSLNVMKDDKGNRYLYLGNKTEIGRMKISELGRLSLYGLIALKKKKD
jgi:hypothetical protein